MKNMDRRSAVALGLLPVLTPAVLRPAAAQTSDEEAVRAAVAAYYAAFSSRDLKAMEVLWAHTAAVTAIHPFSQTPLFGWQAVRRSYEETFARFADVSISTAEPHIAAHQGVAWVVGTETLRGHRPGGEAMANSSIATNILEKQGDRWLMVLHHASGTPRH
ncbi:YybH family protein [Dankookia rubra]|nr:nuclear transport factor 2 family protein [Dankookia rubra]